GNLMPAYERIFRIYDGHAPVIDAVPYPPSAPTGQLLQGTHYTIAPALSHVDDVTPSAPGGDIDRVDYFFSDPTDPSHPVSAAYSAKAYPFSYSFIGAYSGDGTTPRPFPVWVRAVDTSTNKSNAVLVSMVVLPNTDPSIESASVTATGPVPGVPYAGSALLATVGGFFDFDGSQLTLLPSCGRRGRPRPWPSLRRARSTARQPAGTMRRRRPSRSPCRSPSPKGRGSTSAPGCSTRAAPWVCGRASGSPLPTTPRRWPSTTSRCAPPERRSPLSSSARTSSSRSRRTTARPRSRAWRWRSTAPTSSPDRWWPRWCPARPTATAPRRSPCRPASRARSRSPRRPRSATTAATRRRGRFNSPSARRTTRTLRRRAGSSPG